MANDGNMLDLYICRICFNLFDQATALRNCNHIFCWRCINDKIREQASDGCPICSVTLGPDPLVQLSHDDPKLTALENPSNNLPGDALTLENPNNNLPGGEENDEDEEDEDTDFEFFDDDEDSDSDDDDEDVELDSDNDEDMD